MEKPFEPVKYHKRYEPLLIAFLEQCLPESGRALDINGRHSFYKDIENCFKAFWCMFDQEKVIGAVAVKELDDVSCELKSLYLLEQYHGRGYGKSLLNKAIAYAKESGYEKMYLDSLSTSKKAIVLYSKTGFVETEKYNQNERSDVFMVLDLKSKKKAIFWDSDGTLLYGNESFKTSLIKAFEKFRYSLEDDVARNFMRGVCSWYVPEKDHSDKDGEEWWKDLLGEI